MRSARLRFPLSMSLLVKRATFRLLYLASGTSGRRTALLRLGTVCLLINQGTCFVLIYSRKSGVQRGAAPLRGARGPRSSPSLARHRRWQVITDTRKGVDLIARNILTISFRRLHAN